MRWRAALEKDAAIIRRLLESIKGITPDRDEKLNTLLLLIADKLNKPINGANKKILLPPSNISAGSTNCSRQNLQDCDFCINFDIHWNPVRIIQRFGRIDRIGSLNSCIQLVNFWSDVSLDEYINLKARVENRMRAAVVTAAGNNPRGAIFVLKNRNAAVNADNLNRIHPFYMLYVAADGAICIRCRGC